MKRYEVWRMNTHIKILLVEDNPGDVRMIREMLSGHKGGPVRDREHRKTLRRIETSLRGKIRRPPP